MNTRGLANVGHGLVGLATLLACADAAPNAESPSEPGTASGLARADSPWWCLDQAPSPLPEPRSEPVGFALPVLEWSTRQPLAGRGLTATLCPGIGFNCEQPLAAPYVVSDGRLGATQLPPGMAGVPIIEGFDGFIRFHVLAPPGTPSEQLFLPTNYFLGGAISGDLTLGPTVMMSQRNTWKAMVQQSLLDADPLVIEELGTVLLGAYDCNGAPANEVRIELSVGGRAATVTAFLLSTSRLPIAQSADQPLVTGSSGMVGFVGVPPGTAQLFAFRAGDTEPFGSAQLGVVPGQVSMASLRPAYILDAGVLPVTPE